MSRAIQTASLGLTIALLAATPSGSQGAEIPCDTLRPVSNVLGYRLREADVRCEGLYESTVRAIGLELVGVMAGGAFDLLQTPLEIVGPDVANLPSQPGGQIYLRAVALPLKTYYRMDGVLDGNSRFLWPIHEVVWPAGLDPGNIALYGWVGTEMDKTFVPVSVVAGGTEDSGPRTIQLMLRVSSDADSIYWRMTEAGVESDWEPAVEGPVRSGQTIAVDLPQGPPSEVRVDVTAKTKDSDEWTTLRFRVFRAAP